MIRTMKKTLIMSSSFPPSVSGTATVLRNLFYHFPKDSYFVMRRSEEPVEIDSDLDYNGWTLDLRNLTRSRFIARSIEYLQIPLLIIQGLRFMSKYKIDNIFANFPGPGFCITAFILHKLTGKPLFIYMHDTWEEAKVNPVAVMVAKFFEKRIFDSCSRIFVISEALYKLYRCKYEYRRNNIILLPHSINIDKWRRIQKNIEVKPKDSQCIKIVFTGAIYAMNLDAMQNLIKAVNLISEKDVRVTICTSINPEWLKAKGICGPKVDTFFAETRQDLYSIQRQADILFLPMGFNTPFPEESKTAFPTKIFDYMLANRPILVHAPPDSFLAKKAREEGFGLVIDALDPVRLKEGILELYYNKGLADQLCERAQTIVQRHDSFKISKLLQRELWTA